MRVFDFSSASPPSAADATLEALPPQTAACLGAFDGMHRGHQALLRRAGELRERIAVVTFEPRPADVLAPERAPPRLQTPSQRERVCRELGVDALVVLRFDRSVSQMTPAAFAERFLVTGLSPAAVVVGYDFRFGQRRAGDPPRLAELLAPADIELAVVDKVGLEAAGPDGRDEKLGSTRIRELVAAGELERAAVLLGRFYALEGRVEHGAARGRGLGYPTANIASPNLHPAGGVYACFLSLLDDAGRCEQRCWPAVANLGTNPTFTAGSDGPAPRTLEVHALDVDLGDSLYGRRVEVSLVARLRDELSFSGPDALREAIAADIQNARPLLTDQAASRRHARPLRAPSTDDEGHSDIGSGGGAGEAPPP